MNVNRWEFRHSKSNRQFIDGILNLTDFGDSKKLICDDNNFEKRKIIGCNAISSSKNPDTVFFLKIDEKGILDYCIFSDRDSNPDLYADNDHVISAYKKINFDQLAGMGDCSGDSSFNDGFRKDDDDFTPPSQSTFYLSFYWDEIRQNLTQQ